MQRQLTIAIFQYDIDWLDNASNLLKLDVFFEQISREVDVVVLPEMFNTGFTMQPHSVAQTMQGETLKWLRKKAHERDVLIIGSLILLEAGKYYNRCVQVYPDGIISYQDKRHLFSYAGEDEAYTPATERKVFEWKGWRFFCAVCYDLRFPVWCRNDLAFDALIYVANWPESRIGAWDKLLVARAIENQAYVLAANRIGTDGNDLHYSGHSAVIEYNGNVQSQWINKSGIVYGKMEAQALKEYRMQYRFLDDRDRFTLL